MSFVKFFRQREVAASKLGGKNHVSDMDKSFYEKQ